VVLTCVTLFASDADHLSCAFAIRVSSVVKYLLKSFAHLKNSLSFELKEFFIFLDTNSLSDTCFVTFLSCLWHLFCFLFEEEDFNINETVYF
jgi:hypothetical protein